jgi:hypothetical protein
MTPTLQIMRQLIQTHSIEVIFCSTVEYKDDIESIGAKFFEYNFYPKNLKSTSNNINFYQLQSGLFKMTLKVLKQLIDLVETQQPDLIIFDKIATPAKYLIGYLNKKQMESTTKQQSLAISKGLCLTQQDLKSIEKNKTFLQKLNAKFHLFQILLTQIELKFKYGFPIHRFIKIIFPFDGSEQTIVTLLPELERELNVFENTFFVGPIIVDKKNNNNNKSINELIVFDDSINRMLDNFPIRMNKLSTFLDKNFTMPVKQQQQKRCFYLILTKLFIYY